MAVTQAQRQARAVSILERRQRYQFGQPKSEDVGNAGCTDTCIQLIVQISKGKNVSLNRVRQRTGAPHGAPMLTSQALRGLASFGLVYLTLSGATAGRVVTLAKSKGPVILCYKYWSGPQWKGYKYRGVTLTGFARNDSNKLVKVGFAKPLANAGLSQWNFRGGHAALVVGSVKDTDGTEYAILRDPNHNSAARPERPAYDLVTLDQLNRMLESWGPNSLVLAPRDASNPPNVPDGGHVPNPKPDPNDDPEDEKWLDPEDPENYAGNGAILTAGLGAAGLLAAVLAGIGIVILASIGASRAKGNIGAN